MLEQIVSSIPDEITLHIPWVRQESAYKYKALPGAFSTDPDNTSWPCCCWQQGDASGLCWKSWLLLFPHLVFFTEAKRSFFSAGKQIMDFGSPPDCKDFNKAGFLPCSDGCLSGGRSPVFSVLKVLIPVPPPKQSWKPIWNSVMGEKFELPACISSS